MSYNNKNSNHHADVSHTKEEKPLFKKYQDLNNKNQLIPATRKLSSQFGTNPKLDNTIASLKESQFRVRLSTKSNPPSLIMYKKDEDCEQVYDSEEDAYTGSCSRTSGSSSRSSSWMNESDLAYEFQPKILEGSLSNLSVELRSVGGRLITTLLEEEVDEFSSEETIRATSIEKTTN